MVDLLSVKTLKLNSIGIPQCSALPMNKDLILPIIIQKSHTKTPLEFLWTSFWNDSLQQRDVYLPFSPKVNCY